jgi:hypothetical protein
LLRKVSVSIEIKKPPLFPGGFFISQCDQADQYFSGSSAKFRGKKFKFSPAVILAKAIPPGGTG